MRSVFSYVCSNIIQDYAEQDFDDVDDAQEPDLQDDTAEQSNIQQIIRSSQMDKTEMINDFLPDLQ